MKTKEELTALKNEVESLSKKLAELTEEELAQVTGGTTVTFDVPTGADGKQQYEINIYPKTDPGSFTPKHDQ